MTHPERHDDTIRHIGGERRPEPRRLLCPSASCSAEAWYIEDDPRRPETWLITAELGGSPWVIAADEPICPYCAATLGERHEAELDIGPFSHFVRSLAA